MASAQTLPTSDGDNGTKTVLPPPSTSASPTDKQAVVEKPDSTKIVSTEAGSGRFNPTEEVSKDLSVSFPVDI